MESRKLIPVPVDRAEINSFPAANAFLLFQEVEDVPTKGLRILEKESVAGIGVDNERGILDVLCHRQYEFIVGTMTSLLPFATNTGCLSLRRAAGMPSSFPRDQAIMAATWALIVTSEDGRFRDRAASLRAPNSGARQTGSPQTAKRTGREILQVPTPAGRRLQ